MDRQPNDRLGRRGLERLSEHRRQILRAIKSSSNADAHGNNYSYSHVCSESHTDGNSHSDAYAVIHATSITYAKNSPDPEESAHAAAAPEFVVTTLEAQETQSWRPLR